MGVAIRTGTPDPSSVWPGRAYPRGAPGQAPRRERFVEQEQIWLGRQGACQRHPAVAARPRAGRAGAGAARRCHVVSGHEDALFLGLPGTGESHLAQAIGHAAIQQSHKVLYREAHVLLENRSCASIYQ